VRRITAALLVLFALVTTNAVGQEPKLPPNIPPSALPPSMRHLVIPGPMDTQLFDKMNKEGEDLRKRLQQRHGPFDNIPWLLIILGPFAWAEAWRRARRGRRKGSQPDDVLPENARYRQHDPQARPTVIVLPDYYARHRQHDPQAKPTDTP
jgi:hypothetical protein